MNSLESLSRRDEHLARGRALQAEARDVLQPLNEDLSEFRGHEAVVLFGLDERSLTATAIATVETNAPIDEHRHEFRRANVDNHVTDMAVTALGNSVRELGSNPALDSRFEMSRLEPQSKMTWTARPEVDNDKAVATVELAFHKDHGIVPDIALLERIYKPHRPKIADILQAFRRFEQEAGPVRHSLELQEPTTVNAAIFRWDLEGSTGLMLSHLKPIAANYIRDLKTDIKASIGEDVRAIIDGGDGQNIIIDLPKDIDWTDPDALKKFEQDYLEPTLEAIRSRHASLATKYEELLSPALHLSAEVGYVEPNQLSYLEDSVLWRVADKLKQK